MVYWKCITIKNSRFIEKFEYISDPSRDLIERFKVEIVEYEDPKKHEAYEQCANVERQKGHNLFVIRGRVEIILKIDEERKKLIFKDCEDN